MTTHQKHAKLAQPDLGVFARREWALMGAPCSLIQSLTEKIIEDLGRNNYKVAYVDADHQAAASETLPFPEKSRLVYTDKIDFQRFDIRQALDSFQYRQWFNDQDLVLVNGNHFKAKRQLVIIDPQKFDSLQRKLDRLSQVDGFIQTDPVQEIPDFLKDHLPNWQTLPVWPINEHQAVADFLRRDLNEHLPPLKGLVLAGGKSQRMGRDKGQLIYHGLPQREYLYQLFEDLGVPAYLSCRPEQVEAMPPGRQLLPDSFVDLGPYGAILSAFRQDPNAAWLVIACDLPFVDRAGLEYLITQRDPSAMATALHNPATGFPDPLLTLWEPRAYSVMLQFLAQGYSCPRKVLINSRIKLVEGPNDYLLTNVNNPVEFEKAKKKLDQFN